MTRIALTVNGREVEADVEPRTHLADFLREQLSLTGTHIGCEHGICGACTVEINGEISRSCITYAVACDGAEVRTLEGFADDRLMGRLKEAFSKHHALQCGYCTPGMLVASRDLICRKGGLTEAQIRTEMSGNLCRCTGYVGLVRAIGEVMAEREGLIAKQQATTWLGPPPGAGAAGAITAAATIKGTARPAVATTAASPVAPLAPSGPPVALADEAGMTRMSQSFTIAARRDEVWRAMADIERVAQCMPGVSLDAPVGADGRFTGRMQVKLGPIAASFAGEGIVTRLEQDYRGIIAGRGRDTKSASQAQGRVEYTLSEAAADATRVDVAIAYALTGPLAQFSRGSIVKDLVGRLAETFARNLEGRLKNPEAALQTAELNAFSLFFSVVWSRIKRLFGSR